MHQETTQKVNDDPLRQPSHLTLDSDESSLSHPSSLTSPSSLTIPLRILFGLNGATLSLPSTALLYIVNTRAQVPLVYLSVYGALAFLPNSLKPLYAWATDAVSKTLRRDQLLTALWLVSAVSLFGTATIDGVLSCFLWAITREVFSAWPEFLHGVTLLEQAALQPSNNFDATAALYQSQAATARNAGSMVAHVVGFLFFLLRHEFQSDQEQLSEFAVVLILVATGLLCMVGAGIAWYFGVGASSATTTRSSNYARLHSRAAENDALEVHEDELPEEESTASPPPSSSCSIVCGDALLIILLQTVVIFFAMRGPVVSASSVLTWNVILLVLTIAMLLTAGVNWKHWTRPHRVGLFLIVRHAIPSGGYMMTSFIYSLFQSTPMVMQLFSIFGMAVTTLSSWTYGRLLAPYSAGNAFFAVIIGTTLLGALLSLLHNFVLLTDKDDNPWRILATVMAVSLFTDFSGELSFLPSVVLATTAVNFDKNNTTESAATAVPLGTESDDDNDEHLETTPVSYQQMKVSSSCCRQIGNGSVAMQYGTLVSCLDFGDQIGSWLTMPLVAALGISRENDWENMNTFIWVTALLSLIPLTLLPCLRK